MRGSVDRPSPPRPTLTEKKKGRKESNWRPGVKVEDTDTKFFFFPLRCFMTVVPIHVIETKGKKEEGGKRIVLAGKNILGVRFWFTSWGFRRHPPSQCRIRPPRA